jgi:hypothetical protein
VTQTVFPTIPPRVDYELTDLGRSLWQPVEALGIWAREHLLGIHESRLHFDEQVSVFPDELHPLMTRGFAKSGYRGCRPEKRQSA